MKNPAEALTMTKSTVATTSIDTNGLKKVVSNTDAEIGTEPPSESTSLPSLESIGEFEKAGQFHGGEYEGEIDLSDDYSLTSELGHLRTIVESSKRRNRQSLSKELKDLWEGLQGNENEIQLESHVFETSSDFESIYETDESPAETVFRSKSFDELFGEHKGVEDHVVLVDEKDKKDLLRKKLYDEKVKGEETEDDSQKLVPSPSRQSITSSGNEILLDQSFSNILTRDIFKDESTDMSTRPVKQEIILNVSDSEIIQLIVEQLKRELTPTLQQLTKESEKYQILKKLYKLPSVSNLNEQMQRKYKRGSKKFNLEFDESVIQELINKKRNELDDKLKGHVLLPHDQVKLNFNKFRRLNTITEDSEVSQHKIDPKPVNTAVTDEQRSEVLEEKSGNQSDRVDTLIEYECQKEGYQRHKDNRFIKDLSTGELKSMKVMLVKNQLTDISKVKQICGLFEMELFDNNQGRPIGKQTNSTLSSSISKEIIKRGL